MGVPLKKKTEKSSRSYLRNGQFKHLLVVLSANSQNLMIFSAVLVLLALNQGHCTRKLGRRPHMWFKVGLMQSNITTVYTI